MAIQALATTIFTDEQLAAEKKSVSREIGVISFADNCLFFKAGLKKFYVAYDDIKRCFRRVMDVNTKMCCGRGNLRVESIVLCDDEKELAVIQTPGERAAKEIMKEMEGRAKNAILSAPPKQEEELPAAEGGN